SLFVRRRGDPWTSRPPRLRARPGELHDASTELDAAGFASEEREWCDRIGAIGFGRPYRVVTELFGVLREIDRHLQIGARVTAQRAKLHRHALPHPRIRTGGALEQVSARAGRLHEGRLPVALPACKDSAGKAPIERAARPGREPPS